MKVKLTFLEIYTIFLSKKLGLNLTFENIYILDM